MRLTLRTMLAYLDDILEPSDAEEIQQKIEESKFASELVHRIRNSTRRLRLGAPQLDGRGMGLDPNTVAEYLDNTLPPEQVSDFEKVCLESDVHLSEVACCHQVLALVLGEPADVDPAVRERIYAIGRAAGEGTSAPRSEVASSELSEQAESFASAVDESLADDNSSVYVSPRKPSGQPKARVPDYMRTGSRPPWKSLVLTLLGGFLLVYLAIRSIGPPGPGHPILQFFAGQTRSPRGEQRAEVAGGKAEDKAPRGTTTTGGGRGPETEGAASALDPRVPSEPSKITPAAPSPPVESVQQPAIEPMKPVVPPPTPSSPDPAREMPAEDGATKAAETVSAEVKDGTSPAKSVAPKEAETPRPAEPVSIGRYFSEEQVLGRIEPDSSTWFRLAPDAPIVVGDRLLSLPTYRPQVLLAPNIKATLVGETSIRIETTADAAGPCLHIEYGRVMLVSVASGVVQLRLRLAGRQGEVILKDAESAAAMEVAPFLPPGSDPLAAKALSSVRLFAVSGQVAWSQGAEPQVIGVGQALQFVDDGPVQAFTSAALPSWIEARDLSDIERRASQELTKHLTLGRPLSLSLTERTEFRQAEVRALACRCLGSLDLFEPMLKALNDESQRAYWYSQFDALRWAVVRSRESASKLLATLEEVQNDDAGRIFRLISGYSPEQLQGGGAAELVSFLEHPDMIVRVLAYENLRRITGKTRGFRPEQPPGQEKGRVLQWQKSVQDGEVRYTVPTPSVPGSSEKPNVVPEKPTLPAGTR